MTINITAADLTAKAKLLGMSSSLTYDQKIRLYRGMIEEAGLNMPIDPAILANQQSLLDTEKALVTAIEANMAVPAPA